MKIAYLIMVHRNLDQCKRLFLSIYHPENIYVFHADKKCSKQFVLDLEKFLQPYTNTSVESRFRCTWGGYSILQTELYYIDFLLKSDSAWCYLINLSGQDFPLKSQAAIREVLSHGHQRNYVEVQRMWEEPSKRAGKIGFELFGKLRDTRVTRRPWFEAYGGSQWFILNRETCKYLVSNNAFVSRLRSYYRFSPIPDEGFFQTAILNSYLSDQTNEYNLRMITWLSSGRPKVYTVEDLSDLIKSSAFFARKFDEGVDSKIIDMLEERLRSESHQV